mgnify:FL=1|jgi:uncharacterized protein YqeY
MPAMTTPQKQIEQQVQAALKASDRDRLDTLRMLLSAIHNERIRTGAEVDEETLWSLARKGIKQRRESSEQYRSGGRDDLADKEDREAEILAEFLPPPVDEEELTEAIRSFVESEELSGPQAIGPIMKAMMARYSGRADGSTINRLARQILDG